MPEVNREEHSKDYRIIIDIKEKNKPVTTKSLIRIIVIEYQQLTMNKKKSYQVSNKNPVISQSIIVQVY